MSGYLHLLHPRLGLGLIHTCSLAKTSYQCLLKLQAYTRTHTHTHIPKRCLARDGLTYGQQTTAPGGAVCVCVCVCVCEEQREGKRVGLLNGLNEGANE